MLHAGKNYSGMFKRFKLKSIKPVEIPQIPQLKND